jgi:hypothetical protein
VVSSDRLTEELWAGQPALGRDVLGTTPAGYLLELDRDRIDRGRFERLVEEARAGRRLDLASGGSVVALLG